MAFVSDLNFELTLTITQPCVDQSHSEFACIHYFRTFWWIPEVLLGGSILHYVFDQRYVIIDISFIIQWSLENYETESLRKSYLAEKNQAFSKRDIKENLHDLWNRQNYGPRRRPKIITGLQNVLYFKKDKTLKYMKLWRKYKNLKAIDSGPLNGQIVVIWYDSYLKRQLAI